MANNEPRLYLICYDIAEPHRLGRVYRYLCDQAVPVQYSVFLAEMTLHRIHEVLDGIEERIDSQEDDVRIYPLPRTPRIISLGQPSLPDGIMLVNRGGDMIAPVVKAA